MTPYEWEKFLDRRGRDQIIKEGRVIGAIQGTTSKDFQDAVNKIAGEVKRYHIQEMDEKEIQKQMEVLYKKRIKEEAAKRFAKQTGRIASGLLGALSIPADAYMAGELTKAAFDSPTLMNPLSDFVKSADLSPPEGKFSPVPWQERTSTLSPTDTRFLNKIIERRTLTQR